MMKLTQLRNLAAVIEAGAVRQAALTLHLSQSSVSKSIQQLEEELGVELLRRGAHGVAPTEAGKALLARAKAVDAELRHARNDLQAIQGASIGEIRVAASPTVAMALLPRTIVAFQRRRPRVGFRIQEGVFPDILPAVRMGEIDFAICLVPSRPRDENLTVVSLIRDRVVPAVRAGHPLVGAAKLHLADLLDLNWIIYRRGHTGLDVFEQTFVASRLQPPRSTIECTSFACALSLVENGDYITLVPTQIFSGNGRSQSIAPLPLDTPMPPWQVAVISRASHELSAVCHAFLAELQRTAARVNLPVGQTRGTPRSCP
jgi:LysR family transcriptional regulator of abg operon